MFKSTLNLSEKLNQSYLYDENTFKDFCDTRDDYALDIFNSSKIGNRPAISCSALYLKEEDYQKIMDIALLLHENIEKTADLLMKNKEKRKTLFHAYQPYEPYLNKTLNTWQTYSRYDFVFDNNSGDIKFLEFNTSCPGGFAIIPKVHQFMRDFMGSNQISYEPIEQRIDNIANFTHELSMIEKNAGFQPKDVAILNDDFNMNFELEALKKAFEGQGRTCVLTNLANLKLQSNHLKYQDHDISLSYNKFRIAGDPGYCWPSNFKEKYQNYLQAIQKNSFLPVNNLGAILYLSDKNMLSIMQHQDIIKNAELDTEILQYLPWSTHFLNDIITYKDIEYDRKTFLMERQNSIVLKHVGMSRGKGVFIGKDINKKDWMRLINTIELKNYTAQEYIDLWRPNIMTYRSQIVEKTKMYQTGAIYIVNSKPFGIMSRVS